MRIGIIIGSIREGRAGSSVAQWVHDNAQGRGHEYTLLDLKTFDVPLLTAPTPPGAANKEYADPTVQAWSKAIDECDGYIFVTPEYNHGVPGAFKNAFDSLGNEWAGKPVGFVSYGAESGVRAVEQWRQCVANFSMQDVRAQVSLRRFEEFDDEAQVQPIERRDEELTALLDQLEAALA